VTRKKKRRSKEGKTKPMHFGEGKARIYSSGLGIESPASFTEKRVGWGVGGGGGVV